MDGLSIVYFHIAHGDQNPGLPNLKLYAYTFPNTQNLILLFFCHQAEPPNLILLFSTISQSCQHLHLSFLNYTKIDGQPNQYTCF